MHQRLHLFHNYQTTPTTYYTIKGFLFIRLIKIFPAAAVAHSRGSKTRRHRFENMLSIPSCYGIWKLEEASQIKHGWERNLSNKTTSCVRGQFGFSKFIFNSNGQKNYPRFETQCQEVKRALRKIYALRKYVKLWIQSGNF